MVADWCILVWDDVTADGWFVIDGKVFDELGNPAARKHQETTDDLLGAEPGGLNQKEIEEVVLRSWHKGCEGEKNDSFEKFCRYTKCEVEYLH